MSIITRNWLALAALGAGLIHLAVGAGSPLYYSIPLVALGIAELAWGVVTLRGDRPLWPRIAFGAFLSPIAGYGMVLGVAIVAKDPAIASGLPVFPLLAASAFGIFVSATLAASRRRERVRIRRAPGTGRVAVALVVGALVVSGVTTPALAGTNAGLYAVPHGQHGFDFGGGHSGH